MTERELIYIKTIAEEKKISKAAEKLFMTQPSLSKCVQNVECKLGVKLFRRTSNGLILTFAGEEYYKNACMILKICNDFENKVSDINDLKKGRVTIGITPHLATFIIPVILSEFKQRCPNIEVFIVEKDTHELEETLSSGDIDFAIMHVPPSHEIYNDVNIDFFILHKDFFLLTTKGNHPLGKYAKKYKGYKYPKIDFTLFKNEPFIMISHGHRIRQVTELIMRKANINPAIVQTTNSYETARRMAFHGIGATFVPEQYLQIYNTVDCKPDYYYIDEKYTPYWSLCIAVEKNAYVSKAAKLFIEMVSNRFASTS
ncbi:MULTISPECIES: LysR family transcriptional regulator [Clostridium]|uniref:LysR family transcriptional regulator n=1 Tax=Clostridium TaxID=1485 RepID=UPI000824BC6A|nr:MULTISPECIES: LysR family transcriptional regulator [Clostridium]PJI08527.1 LysR family transcriptional regulator [Clostridium sp. CT7]